MVWVKIFAMGNAAEVGDVESRNKTLEGEGIRLKNNKISEKYLILNDFLKKSCLFPDF